MFRSILTVFTLPALLLLGSSSDNSAARVKQKNNNTQVEIVDKLMVGSGTVNLALDLNQLNGAGPATDAAKLETLPFTLAADSFFVVEVSNDLFRSLHPGLIGITPQKLVSLPAILNASFNQLVLEERQPGEVYDLVLRDGKTGFVFFNVEGHSYDYDSTNYLFRI